MNTQMTLQHGTPNRQHGAITLAISLILLFLITIVTLSVTRNISVEQKVANNDVRSRLAFEAAEAGIAAAFDALRNPDYVKCLKSELDPATNTVGLTEISTSSKEICTNLVAKYGTYPTPCGTLPNASCLVTLEQLSGTDRFSIESRGYSDDQSATRKVTIRAVKKNALGNLPDAPLTAKSSVIVDGSATVHNPEGDTTIWSGETIDLGSNNSTSTQIADPFDTGFPSCMDTPLTCGTISSSNKVTLGPDIIESDGSLGNFSDEDFFLQYFGVTDDTYCNIANEYITIDATADEVNSDKVVQQADEVICIQGNTVEFSSNSTYGCSQKVTGSNICPANDPDLIDPNAPDFPGYESSILVVKGDAVFNGTVHFYGLVFVTGNLDIKGATTIYGGLVVGGELQNDTGGSLDLYYHSGLLENASELGTFFAAAGSWRDY
jgi:Tfp pilus assembly protein PilX